MELIIISQGVHDVQSEGSRIQNVATKCIPCVRFIDVAKTKTGLKEGSIYKGLPLGGGILAGDFCSILRLLCILQNF